MNDAVVELGTTELAFADAVAADAEAAAAGAVGSFVGISGSGPGATTFR